MKKIGLAFEGGGLKGSYQIGSYYAFLNCHIKISGVVGTSIGSFNAAAIACGKEKELLEFWENINPGEILEINTDLVKFLNNHKFNLSVLKGTNQTVFKILRNHGFKTNNLRKVANNLIDENELRKSPMDYGLVTVKFHKLTPVYLYKEDILPGKLIDSILASCSLPIFKLEPIIDNHIYIDGGFKDNCPSWLLANKGYDKIYEIKINGIGFTHHYDRQNYDITTISPSRNIASILEMNNNIIKENILMGYYDTLRVLKNYDGYKYTFYRYPTNFYNLLTRKIDHREKRRVQNFFGVKSNREIIIKSLEYIFEHEQLNYYHIYHPIIAIYHIKKNYKVKNFIYQFIKALRIL